MRYVLLLLIPGMVLACRPSTTPLPDRDAEEVRRISAERAKAFNKGDAAGIARHFSDTCYLMAPLEPTRTNPAQVKAYYQLVFDRYETALESGYEDVRVDGDLAYGRGFARVTLKDRVTGEVTVSTAKYLNILERQSDGSWKTTHDIWNGNAP
jgi:ketosteroid isomerase-like protein